MATLKIKKDEEMVMKLLHYFITEKNYNPIVLHGAKDEIWLENMDEDYKIIRIVTNYIHNDEQIQLDLFKTEQVIKQIKKKTFSFKVKAINIFLNLNEGINLEELEDNNLLIANIKAKKDIKKYDFLNKSFPNLMNFLNTKDKGEALFSRLTKEISNKNEKDNKKIEKVFKDKKPTISNFLIYFNFAIYSFMFLLRGEFNINGTLLFILGALEKNAVLGGQVIRILTSGFLHASLLHILFNMYALYVLGPQIEKFLGKKKFIYIYIFSLISSSLMSLTFMQPGALSVGASGAIFGLLGSLAVFGYYYRVYLGNVLKSQILPILLLNLMIGLTVPGIDNGAHIGGLIGGILATLAVGVDDKTDKVDKINARIISLLLIGLLSFLIIKK